MLGSDFELLYIETKYAVTISRRNIDSWTANRVGTNLVGARSGNETVLSLPGDFLDEVLQINSSTD